VLVVKATSMQLNPTLPADEIEAEIAADPDLKRAEYLCEWREDISSFVASEIVDAATLKGIAVIPPDPAKSYVAFLDLAGGANGKAADSHALGIAFQSEGGDSVLACAREIKSSNVEAVAAEFSALLKAYGCSFAYADEYGKGWTKGAFTRHGTELRSSPYYKNEVYLNFLPALNSGKVKILDLPRLRQQLLALERSTSRITGRDTVSHPNAGHDDLINAAAGALVMAERAERRGGWLFASVGHGGGGGVWDASGQVYSDRPSVVYTQQDYDRDEARRAEVARLQAEGERRQAEVEAWFKRQAKQ
jgi:hypothetical protein